MSGNALRRPIDPAEAGRTLVALRADVLGRDQLVEHGEVALVEAGVEQLLDFSLVLVSGLIGHGGAPG